MLSVFLSNIKLHHFSRKKILLQNKDTRDLRFVSFQIAWVEFRCDGFKTWLPSERADWDYRLQGTTLSFHLADSNLVSRARFGTKTSTQHLTNLFSNIKQKGTESVVIAVIAEETSNGQVDSHLVPSLQMQNHNSSGTVLLVILILVSDPGHHLAVNL